METWNVPMMYIVHGINGYTDRYDRLNNILTNELHASFEFVTEFENEELNNQLIAKYFVPDVKHKLPKSHLFCTLVHFLIYEKIANSNDSLAIILENDACFLSDFTKKIQSVVKEAETLPDGYIISLENSTLEFPSLYKVKKGKYLYKAKYGRCAGGYMIDKTAAKKMLALLQEKKCDLVIDWWHNQIVQDNILPMYWAHPPLIEQGSFNGLLSSSVSNRVNGKIRRAKWLLQKYYKMYLLRLFK